VLTTLKTQLRPAIVGMIVFTVLTGLVYPLAITGIAQLLFPHEANGSLMARGGKATGSELIGQGFNDAGYFWSRPSATSPQGYNGAASSGSNLGPSNPALTQAVADRIQALRNADPGNALRVPVDLVTASASGLDPHVSPAAAAYQAARVARARGLREAEVLDLVARSVEGRQWGVLGEPRVNVLRLNIALDDLVAQTQNR
jgi:potassium-transporting ATPase KdpC subunit